MVSKMYNTQFISRCFRILILLKHSIYEILTGSGLSYTFAAMSFRLTSLIATHSRIRPYILS